MKEVYVILLYDKGQKDRYPWGLNNSVLFLGDHNRDSLQSVPVVPLKNIFKTKLMV